MTRAYEEVRMIFDNICSWCVNVSMIFWWPIFVIYHLENLFMLHMSSSSYKIESAMKHAGSSAITVGA